MEVKNQDEKIEFINSSKSKSKNSLKNSGGRNNTEKEGYKTDIINLDKPMNSPSSNPITSKNEQNNRINNSSNINNQQNGVDGKNINNTNNDIVKTANLKGKQEDISIVEITSGGRVISDLEIKNAPILLLEVN